MGFYRTLQPQALDRASLKAVVEGFVAQEAPDPFLIAHDCLNPKGHYYIASCGDIVCRHCTKVVWQ